MGRSRRVFTFMIAPIALCALALTSVSQTEPVLMAERAIGPAAPIIGGTVHEVVVGEHNATLFVPQDWKPKAKSDLWVHFHTAPWFIVQEHQRAKMREPVLIFDLGQGSATYVRPFAESGAWAKWQKESERVLASAGLSVKLGQLNFTSFSAGYGAVRNLIADPFVLDKLETVILCDSFYGARDPSKPLRAVLPAHIDVWTPLAHRALSGKCRLIITTTQITPDTYAGTWEVAHTLVQKIGSAMSYVPAGSIPAATGSQALIRRFDQGGLHVWSYAGNSAEAHMTHARRLAELIVESRKR